MSEKRRDSKGRLLQAGERQRSDGMYEFRYLDNLGKKHSVYSWKLVSTDKIPAGKRCKEPLRDMERKIARDLEDGVDAIWTSRTTLNDCFDEYIETKYELKPSTRTNYRYMYNKFVRGDLGCKKIGSITYSDVKKFYIHLINDIGFKLGTLGNVHNILHPVFTIAVRDGKIRINPSDSVMAEIKKSHNWTSSKRHALTIPQQEAFINFCANSNRYKHWLPLFTVLLGTGCRVGELAGLRWDDCDFENNMISVNHSLLYRAQDNGSSKFYISTPKTKAGERIIPMLSAVKNALLQEHKRQKRHGFSKTVIDGYSGFVFVDKCGHVMTPSRINQVIKRICGYYNAKEKESAKLEQREPILLPYFSAHNLRHTFCTRFCENETNIKVIQEIMGHADISTTMNIYNEATMEKKKESFSNLDGKIKIA